MEEIIPHHKYFATQREEEEVLHIARRHWIVYVPVSVAGAVVFLACLVLFFNLGNIEIVRNNEAVRAFAVSLVSIFMLLTALFVYITWIVNYLNFQLVTNEHIVDIDQLGLFSRKISELSLEDIQDVSATQKGVLQSFFHYGDITIQTAGEKPNFVFEKVKDPYELSKKIMEIKDQYGGEEVKIVSGTEDSVTESISDVGDTEVK